MISDLPARIISHGLSRLRGLFPTEARLKRYRMCRVLSGRAIRVRDRRRRATRQEARLGTVDPDLELNGQPDEWMDEAYDYLWRIEGGLREWGLNRAELERAGVLLPRQSSAWSEA